MKSNEVLSINFKISLWNYCNNFNSHTINSVFWTNSQNVSNVLNYIPVVARCKAWACGRSRSGIAGSNPSVSMNVSVVCCQVEVSCVGLTIGREEFYRLWCVCV